MLFRLCGCTTVRAYHHAERCVTTMLLLPTIQTNASLLVTLQALQKYKQIHADFPANIECLRYLVHICNEQGMPDMLAALATNACQKYIYKSSYCVMAGLRQEETEYAAQLRKAERSQQQSRVSTGTLCRH